jgi:hypothetical protein
MGLLDSLIDLNELTLVCDSFFMSTTSTLYWVLVLPKGLFYCLTAGFSIHSLMKIFSRIV